jgi:predicted nucleic acid-binding protein
LAAAEAVYVFDACAVIALLHAEPGAREVAVLLKPGRRRLIHIINLCEVYYDMLRRGRVEAAHSLEKVLGGIGLEIDSGVPSSIWQRAGDLKARLRRISLADCFAMALTLQENGVLVTSDHRELDPVAEAGICPIHFFR